MTDADIRTYPDSPTLLRSLDAHGVLLLTLNRPERNNAWTPELEEAYFGSLLAAAEDPTVRVIVVTGAGKSFCPGLDALVLSESATAGKPITAARRWPMTVARLIPKPVIAAVNGAAAGLGFVQVAAADLRFASTSAKFATAFSRRGLPAEHSLSWLLPRLIGTGAAMDLLLSSRAIGAEEAKAIGLVNAVYEPDELLPATLAYAHDLAANCSPSSMAAIKGQVRLDLDRGAEEARLSAFVTVAELASQPDFKEGVASFVERRPPQFEGLARRVDVTRGW